MVKHFQDDPDPPPFIKALAEVRQLAASGKAGATSMSKPSRWRLISTPPKPMATANSSSRIGEAVSCAASHETCADIPGLPRNKRILHDTIF